MALNGQRTVANVRERKRTQKLNQAYKRLQSIIPKEPSDKMSKINILKLALSYIKFLSRILEESECSSTISTTTNSEATASCVTVPDTFHNATSTVSLCGSPECGSSPDSFHSAYLYQSTVNENDDDQQYQHRSKRMKVSPAAIQSNHHQNHTTNDQIYHPYAKVQQGVDICYHQTGVPSCHNYSNLSQVSQAYYSTQTYSPTSQMSSGAPLATTIVYDQEEPNFSNISHDNAAHDVKLELAQLFREYRSCNNFNLV